MAGSQSAATVTLWADRLGIGAGAPRPLQLWNGPMGRFREDRSAADEMDEPLQGSCAFG